MNATFVRERITALRLQKGVSEYKMSYDLGHSRGYINNISSGKALPSLSELFAICDYFNMTILDIFDEKTANPVLSKEITYALRDLNTEDLTLVLDLIHRLSKNTVPSP